MKKINKDKTINILVAGGSGHWAELNHYPSILKLKRYGVPLKLVAICDVRDPRKEMGKNYLPEILNIDRPLWLNPTGLSEKQIENELDKPHQRHNIDIILVSTDPLHHYFYSFWGAKNGINILLDKPLVVTKNAAFDVSKARELQPKYEKLKSLVTKNQKHNPRYTFCLPLRRRALTSFVEIANGLKDVYKKTGEGIRYMNVIINGGVHKYPVEFLKGGAHGYHDGFGALSHSSYHYIDVIAWYLSVAKGNIAKIKVGLSHLLRVKDYLRVRGYKKLRDLVEDQLDSFDDEIELPDPVLNSELDFTFHLKLFDNRKTPIGLVSYTSNHTTFTPRRTKYDPEMLEYTNDKFGGRMSQIYIDVHQGPLQNWQLIKNDVVFFGNNIETVQRLHPKLGRWEKRTKYEDAYDSGTITTRDLFMSFVKHCAGKSVPKKYVDLLSTFKNQDLTFKMYSLFYEKIAEDFHNKRYPNNKVLIDSEINLDQYLS